ncbi:MAG: glutamate-5-semialdehyde dehydrogenase, partial [Candidatus Omnitrophica bacterium]|nr:glutamate-5-semialdehyde dehydrogenase [Candidatus Omnitrophota bacterium]
MRYVKDLLKKAKEASFLLAKLDTQIKNKALLKMAEYLLKNENFILKENQKDLLQATKNKLPKSFIDRLTLNSKRLLLMSKSLEEIAKLDDPVGKLISSWSRPNGLLVQKVRVPIGVILIIYEARPNVTSDCIGLLFKSANVGILRGGSDAFNSNLAIANVLYKAIKDVGIDFSPFFVVKKKDYKVTELLLKEDNFIDLVIPRGGEALIKKVVNLSKIPVIKHYKGVCHIYVDNQIDFDKALNICVNAKVQRPAVCNAVEKILVHKDIAKDFLPLLKQEFDKYNVEMRGDKETCKILKKIKRAKKNDWFE